MTTKTQNSTGDSSERHIGLLGATGVGVGAIVGGGILALAGVAFARTGPAAILAFAANGMIALLTALSFAEMASRFPESGGTYKFAKKVLSVEAAFAVGWVVWFASIVAGVLYALGFAHFVWVMFDDLWHAAGHLWPSWFTERRAVTGLAVGVTFLLAIRLIRKPAGGGQWANVGKVIVFAVLIAGGMWALGRRSPDAVATSLQPFFSAGAFGLVQAMGYTFIALQGFDLIAAAGGEIREPARTIPRAMILSLAIALAIYLPMLFLIVTVGVPEGGTVGTVAAENPEDIVAIAAQNYLGPLGYWLVIGAAILSMFSALQANLFAASRFACAMANDRTLPSVLSLIHTKRRTPYAAVIATTVIATVILVFLHDVAAAGAAASLIFLCTFAIAHGLAILVRRRDVDHPPRFRSPCFPVVPVVGGLACVGLAIFQGIAVPKAGLIVLTWLSLGGVLFLVLFARRARIMDASTTALAPELASLRGRTPLVLVPLANPQNAEAMVSVGNALAPPDVGRVLLLTVITEPKDWQPKEGSERLRELQLVLQALLQASGKVGGCAETLVTVAADPMEEIVRVARRHRCQSVLVGLNQIPESPEDIPLERLLGAADADIVVLRTPIEWQLKDVKTILVPVGGRGGHDELVARLLGSLMRTRQCEVTLLRVLPQTASPRECQRAKRNLTRLAEDQVQRGCNVVVLQDDDPVSVLAQEAEQHDLVVLGVQRVGRRTKLFGHIARQVAARTRCPIIVVSRRR